MRGGCRGQRWRVRFGESTQWASRSLYGAGMGIGSHHGTRAGAATTVGKSRECTPTAAETETSGVSGKKTSVSAM